MPRGPSLTAEEKETILALEKQNVSMKQIAIKLNRSRGVVANFLKDPANFNSKKRTGRRPVLSAEEKQMLLDAAAQTGKSAAQLKQDLQLTVHVRTIQRILHEEMGNHPTPKESTASSDLSDDADAAVDTTDAAKRTVRWYRKRLMRAPELTAERRMVRVQWAQRMLERQRHVPQIQPNDHETTAAAPFTWTNVVFSDEKKFRLDGPDGVHCYWHAMAQPDDDDNGLLTDEPQTELPAGRVRYSRNYHPEAPLVSVWGAMSAKGRSKLAFWSAATQDSDDYQQTLTNFLFPLTDDVHEGTYWFQQDFGRNSVYRSPSTVAFFNDLNVKVLTDWPWFSPDLNPMEHVWRHLVAVVYANGTKVYGTTIELQAAIVAAWDAMDQSFLATLVDAMPARLETIIQQQGKLLTG